jgi:hypothetical protein
MVINGNKKATKVAKNICCNICDYTTSKKGDWNKHILTRKHTNANQMLTNANQKATKVAILHQPNNEDNKSIEVTNNHFQCDKCNKVYKHKSTLSRHSKTCKEGKEKIVDTTELILGIMKENKELKEIIVGQNNSILELAKNIQPTNIQTINNNNNTQNSHNKTFNLNLFLNETCKNAMNITDFVDSIKLQLSDLEHLGQVGYVNGITKIIVKSLKSLKEENRPVHCTDQKRKVIYVKDDNKWGKEDDEHKNVRKAIKNISHKNFKMISEYKKKYPCYQNSDSTYSNRYHKLMIETLGGPGKEDSDNEDKIINNISKEILITRNVDNMAVVTV